MAKPFYMTTVKEPRSRAVGRHFATCNELKLGMTVVVLSLNMKKVTLMHLMRLVFLFE